MRVLIVENQPERLAMLVPALEAVGCVVAATLNSVRSLDLQIHALLPDVVIIAQDSPDRDTLEQVCVANQDCPRPIVMFTGDGSAESIRAATQAERKLIDQAKALLIKQTGASEPEVYREMRRAAMDRSLKLADIARQILQRQQA
jgi:response regulator NasT